MMSQQEESLRADSMECNNSETNSRANPNIIQTTAILKFPQNYTNKHIPKGIQQ